MPFEFKLTDLSLPQSWIIPDSSPGVPGVPNSGNAGLMSKEQAIVLAKAAAGSVGGAFVQLEYINGFGNSVEGLPAGVSRLVGVQVQFAGAIQVPDAGAAADLPIGILPASQVPSVPRVISVLWKLGNTMGEANMVIDSGVLFPPPFPPGLIVNGSQALPAAGGGNHTQLLIEGLSFYLDSTPS